MKIAVYISKVKSFLSGNVSMNLPDNITKVKRVNVLQVYKIWNKKPRKSQQSRRDFANEMRKFGWELIGSNACFKLCVAKDSIIAKYARDPNYDDSNNEINREFQQSKLTPWQFKRHLPITYLFHKGLMIQDRVLVKCSKGVYCPKVIKVRNKFSPHLHDYGHNHGHTIKGTVKFFDWVYNRSYDKVEDSSIEFLA